jgi:hypothetical protein
MHGTVGAMPSTCGAKNRAGKPCKKAPVKGRTRCRNHGGKSTGPTTAEGKAASMQAVTDHGAYAKLDAFERLLAAHDLLEPYMAADGTPKLERELRFARAKLVRAAQDPDVSLGAVMHVLGEIRQLAATEKNINPGTGLGGKSFEFRVSVVGEAPPEAVRAEEP